MKNEYIAHGDEISIILRKKDGSSFEVIIDKEDFDIVNSYTGTWYTRFNKYTNSHYAVINTSRTYGKKLIAMHRVIMDFPRGLEVDHVNHNTLDNRRRNLRSVTKNENQQNRLGAQRNNKSSGIRGVYWHKQLKKWEAAIHHDGRKIFLGTFENIENAARASEEARQKYMPCHVVHAL